MNTYKSYRRKRTSNADISNSEEVYLLVSTTQIVDLSAEYNQGLHWALFYEVFVAAWHFFVKHIARPNAEWVAEETEHPHIFKFQRVAVVRAKNFTKLFKIPQNICTCLHSNTEHSITRNQCILVLMNCKTWISNYQIMLSV